MPAEHRIHPQAAPEHAETCLLLVDVINSLDFPGSEGLQRQALRLARQIARLKTRARASRVPVVYVNDNFQRWRSDFRSLVRHCRQPKVPGHVMVELLLPREDDYFVLKPAHSGFYASALDLLLTQIGARTLVLAGVATNICVLFTANDAYMRGYRVVVPRDCVAANTPQLSRLALAQMRDVLKADVRTSQAVASEYFR